MSVGQFQNFNQSKNGVFRFLINVDSEFLYLLRKIKNRSNPIHKII